MDTTVILRPLEPGQLLISDAIAAGESPTWTEAVTIVREIALHVHNSATPLSIPSLSQVAVTLTGGVLVRGGRPYPSGPVQGLGHLLGQLLERSGGPPPVLEVQRQTTADPPIFESPLDLHKALEYFARPDSHGVLTDFYNRASVALEVASKSQAFEALKEKTKAAAPHDEEKREAKPKKSRRLYWVAAIILIPVAAGLIAFSYNRANVPSLAVPAVAAIEAVSAAGRVVSEATTGVISNLIGGATEAPANEPPPAPPPAATPTGASKKRLETPRAKAETAPPASLASPVAPAAPAPDPPPVAEVVREFPVLADVIYSAKDPQVQPPVLVYPQLPTRRREASATDTPSEFDMLVREDGTVAEVRLIPASDRLQDRMMVSAAKAWRFRPADLNGQPVRYRIRIPITW